MIGFGTLDVIDGVEIAGVILELPDTRNIKVFIVGMAGLAAVAGIGFFLVRRRSRKRQSTRHQ